MLNAPDLVRLLSQPHGLWLLAATVVIAMTNFKLTNWWRSTLGAHALMVTCQGIKPLLPSASRNKWIKEFILKQQHIMIGTPCAA